ncbi:hypothetical protein NBRC116592_14350 [Colwellia sp. KU-HH00111]|uniref:hypothetical protein n=1 Tax=Colwellia sp. KU-HH00111 TaxID=3127652 RepID=UPI00310A1C1F
MSYYNYPGIGRQGYLCKGFYVICQFGYHYLACRPQDKPKDPLLNPPLKEFLVSTTYGEQFLQNLHPWKNEQNIMNRMFDYLAYDEYQHANQSVAECIKFIANELALGNLLLIPLDKS